MVPIFRILAQIESFHLSLSFARQEISEYSTLTQCRMVKFVRIRIMIDACCRDNSFIILKIRLLSCWVYHALVYTCIRSRNGYQASRLSHRKFKRVENK